MATWSNNCENALNKQINLELYAAHVYHYLFSYFDNPKVGLKNIANYFNKCSLEEREHGHKLIEYQNKRNGNVILGSINAPSEINLQPDNFAVLNAFNIAYDLEKKVYNSLLSLHGIADSAKDPQFADFIEGEYLEEQIDALNEIKVHITQLERIGDNGHGIWNFNQEFEQ